MDFVKCVESIQTVSDLKRLASAYVFDFRRLNMKELYDALLKTAPQYYNEQNVLNTVNSFRLNSNRSIRVLFDLMISLLLNADDFTMEYSQLEEKVILHEQEIVDIANEQGAVSQESEIEFFRFALLAAWEHNDDVSIDEQNLLNKIKVKLGISEKDYHILEAQIGKYPNPNNLLHTREDIAEARKMLQSKGLICTIRDSNGEYFDVIPCEVALELRKIFGIDIKRHSFELLLDSKYVNNKKYLQDIITKAGIKIPPRSTVAQLKLIILENISAHTLISGFSSYDGLNKETLYNWCADLKLSTSGTKPELVDRIIDYYDQIKQIETEETDERALYYQFFEELAARKLPLLRQQGVIDKDLECERKFEQATNYIFEVIFKTKPLLLSGTEHPDGILSFKDKLIMWDNKSKETDVSLSDHIKQFDRYITSSQKPVAVFMVIAPSFTANSAKECITYSLNSETLILLITATELKKLAESWSAKHKDDESVFPLGFFRQNGRFNSDIVNI